MIILKQIINPFNRKINTLPTYRPIMSSRNTMGTANGAKKRHIFKVSLKMQRCAAKPHAKRARNPTHTHALNALAACMHEDAFAR